MGKIGGRVGQLNYRLSTLIAHKMVLKRGKRCGTLESAGRKERRNLTAFLRRVKAANEGKTKEDRQTSWKKCEGKKKSTLR